MTTERVRGVQRRGEFGSYIREAKPQVGSSLKLTGFIATDQPEGLRVGLSQQSEDEEIMGKRRTCRNPPPHRKAVNK